MNNFLSASTPLGICFQSYLFIIGPLWFLPWLFLILWFQSSDIFSWVAVTRMLCWLTSNPGSDSFVGFFVVIFVVKLVALIFAWSFYSSIRFGVPAIIRLIWLQYWRIPACLTMISMKLRPNIFFRIILDSPSNSRYIIFPISMLLVILVFSNIIKSLLIIPFYSVLMFSIIARILIHHLVTDTDALMHSVLMKVMLISSTIFLYLMRIPIMMVIFPQNYLNLLFLVDIVDSVANVAIDKYWVYVNDVLVGMREVVKRLLLRWGGLLVLWSNVIIFGFEMFFIAVGMLTRVSCVMVELVIGGSVDMVNVLGFCWRDNNVWEVFWPACPISVCIVVVIIDGRSWMSDYFWLYHMDALLWRILPDHCWLQLHIGRMLKLWIWLSLRIEWLWL